MGEDSFGQWIKRRRRALDLTQVELSRLVGCASVTLQKIESNQRRPSREIAELLAEHLGVPSDSRGAFVAFARMDRGQGLGSAAGAALVPAASFQRPSNLPARLSTLIGRQQEAAQVRRRIVDEGVRVLSLVGPPGIGKTSLALKVAADVREDFGDGVFLTLLAPATDPDQVLPAMALTLGLIETGGRSLAERLRGHLRDRHMLLVLDNFEQVLPAAAGVVDLLADCPWLQVLVTSRAPLRVRGERRFQVPPLAVPDPASPQNVEAALRSPAVALFVDRAQAVRPDFCLASDNAGAVIAICRRLDGVPLAIELVAARVDLLPPHELLERLSGSFLLQIGGLRDLPARQRTLHAAIDWSYNLLTPQERTLFGRLAVFSGGCTLDAAEAVCGGPTDAATAAIDALAVLSTLVDSHLVRSMAGPDSEPRVTMLETIREYARERLETSGETETIRDRHAQYFVGVAEAADRELRGPRQGMWLRRLDADHANLLEAFRWLLEESPEGDAALRLGAALWWYWNVRGYLSEGRRWLSTALARAEAAPAGLRAGVLNGVGALAWQQGDPAALSFLQESVALYRQSGDSRGLAFALTTLAMVEVYQGDQRGASVAAEEAVALSRQSGDPWTLALALNPLAKARAMRREYAAARALYEESLGLFRQEGDRWAIAIPLQNLGYVAYLEGEYEVARARLEESITFHREVGERWMLAISLNILGQVAQCQEDYAKAATLYHESLLLLRQIGTEKGIAGMLCSLGLVAQFQGDKTRAAALLTESLEVFSRQGDASGVARCLVGFAILAEAERQFDRAACLLAATEAMYDAAGVRPGPAERRLYDSTLAAVRERILEERFTAAWQRGRAMTRAQAVALAMGYRRDAAYQRN